MENTLLSMLEKAKTDMAFMDKLEELGRKNAAPEEIVALAAEYGFSITAEDLKSCNGNCTKCGELSSEELETVSGGKDIPQGIDNDRFDPNACHAHGRTRYECVGFLQIIYCKYYSKTIIKNSFPRRYHHVCAKGAFNYTGNADGDS